MLQQSHIPLTNGIMSFLEASEDHDLAPIGIGSMHKQAQKLAEYGRHGDIYVVHAAEGETVVPLEVLNANPKVKNMLFNQMREMGLDPEEFVVGNELNSINPVTGMPEFFFSRIWRSVKKVASKAWKGIKAAAPYVLPLVFAAFGVPFLGAMVPGMFGAGTFGAAFLGSGIGTLAAGGTMKDALKAGAMAGVGNVAFAGVSSALSGGDFLGGASKALYNPQAADFGTQWGRFTGALDPAGAAGSWDAFVGGQAPGAAPTVAPPVQPPDISAVQPPAHGPGATAYTGPSTDKPPWYTGSSGQVGEAAAPWRSAAPHQQAAFQQPTTSLADKYTAQFDPALRPSQMPSNVYKGTYAGDVAFPPPADVQPFWQRPLSPQQPSFQKLTDLGTEVPWHKTAGDWYDKNIGKYLQGGKTDPEWTAAMDKGGLDYLKRTPVKLQTSAGLEAARQEAGKGWWAYGPAVAATGLGTAGYMGYEATQPDPEKLEEQEKQKLEDERRQRLAAWHKTTGAYKFYQTQKGGRDNPDYWRYRIPVGANPNPNPWRGTRPYAEGGMAEYPPRDLLVEGPGTERSDEIPAMLSDGEFVMNARSVRGADPSGGGNRYAGANNLYNMMRNFEMRS